MDDRDSDEDTDRRSRPTVAEIRHHRRTVPRGISVLPDDAPAPEPDFSWPLEPDRHDAEILRRAGRDPEDPVRPAEITAIVRMLGGEIARLRIVVEGSERRPGLTQTVEDHTRVIGPARTAASWALRGTVAAVLVVGGFLYQRGAAEQHITDEIGALTDKVGRLERQVEHLTSKDSKQ